MAAPVVESKSSNTSTTTSVVVTAPTGITAGDVLVAHVISTGTSVAGISAPAGWTAQQENGGGTRRVGLYTKIAVTADESATDYTFSMSGATAMNAHITRVSGAASGSEITASDQATDTSTASPSFTVSATPAVAETLVFFSIGAYDTAGEATTSAYASTPTLTWTEQYDASINSGSIDPSLAIATAATSGTTEITALSATLSTLKSVSVGMVLLVRPPINATGSNTLLEVSPTFFSQTGSSGTVGSNTLLETSPTFFSQSGKSTSPTQWTNEAKPSTTWTNEQL